MRRQLPAKMDQWVTLFQIEDIKFDSFKLHFGYQDAMGAVDMVAAVTALLEAGPDQPSQFWTAMDALVSCRRRETRNIERASMALERCLASRGPLAAHVLPWHA